ncbi:hypothetical protein Hanom_Chr06g00524261 [Helianthus anomalus]
MMLRFLGKFPAVAVAASDETVHPSRSSEGTKEEVCLNHMCWDCSDAVALLCPSCCESTVQSPKLNY